MDIKRKAGNLNQLCSVKDYTFNSGREKNQRILEVNNGVFNFMLQADKNLDIGQLYYKGKNISFLSRNGFYTPNAEFGSRFPGGMLYTCGLDSLSVQEGHDVHGRIHNIPSTVKEITSGEKIVIKGQTRQCALFGEDLLIDRTISTDYESDEITVTDVITNDGFTNAGYCALYHINFGYPFLTENTYIESKVKRTEAVNDYSQNGIEKCFTMENPTDDALEKCYYNEVDEGKVCVYSPDTKLKATITFDKTKLPYFTEWRSMVSGAYALGIEPSTTRFFEKLQYKTLKPNESETIVIKLKIQEM